MELDIAIAKELDIAVSREPPLTPACGGHGVPCCEARWPNLVLQRRPLDDFLRECCADIASGFIVLGSD